MSALKINAAQRLLASEETDAASYPGNLGMMEMVKFHKMANPQQKDLMKRYLNDKQFDKGWQLLQDVTNTKLH